jgi:hypothetical protein
LGLNWCHGTYLQDLEAYTHVAMKVSACSEDRKFRFHTRYMLHRGGDSTLDEWMLYTNFCISAGGKMRKILAPYTATHRSGKPNLDVLIIQTLFDIRRRDVQCVRVVV